MNNTINNRKNKQLNKKNTINLIVYFKKRSAQIMCNNF